MTAKYDPHMVQVDEHGLIIRDPAVVAQHRQALGSAITVFVILGVVLAGMFISLGVLDSNPQTKIVGQCLFGGKPVWANQQQLDSPPPGWYGCFPYAQPKK